MWRRALVFAVLWFLFFLVGPLPPLHGDGLSVKAQNQLLLLSNIDQLLALSETKIDSLLIRSDALEKRVQELLSEARLLKQDLLTVNESLTTSQDLVGTQDQRLERLERESNSLYKSLQNKETELWVWRGATAVSTVAFLVLLFGGK